MRSKLHQGAILSLTIHDIPEGLLQDFMELVVNSQYRGGVSEAVIDLMQKAVRERKEQLTEMAAQLSISDKRPEQISVQDYLPFSEYPRFQRSFLMQQDSTPSSFATEPIV